MSAQPIDFGDMPQTITPEPDESMTQSIPQKILGVGRWTRGGWSIAESVIAGPFERSASPVLQITITRAETVAPAIQSKPVLGELAALAGGAEDETIPSEFAFSNAYSVIDAAYGELNRHRPKKSPGVPASFPVPVVTTDEAGGIRLSWRNEAKKVRANFGAREDLRSYVYFESGDEHNVEPLDAEHLGSRLAWLTAR